MAVIFPHSASHPATTEWKVREEPSCAGWLNTVYYIGATYSAAMTVYAGCRELSRTIHKKQRLWKWGRKDDYSAKAAKSDGNNRGVRNVLVQSILKVVLRRTEVK
jgi:hypothetical protein